MNNVKAMKKLLTLLLTLLMVFTLVGCNSKQEETVKVDEPVQQEETVNKEETVVEQQEEVKEEVKEEKKEDTKDITKMKFWVVFYDQYDNELQREALKYGTVPEYKGWLPEGFDNWVYKKSGKEVSKFKAITGNTYFKAVCHEVEHHSSSSGSGSNPTPTPSTVTVTFAIGASGYSFLQEQNSLTNNIMFGESKQYTSGVEYSFDGEKITIDGVTYNIIKVSEGAFSGWTVDPNPTTPGHITEDTTISASFDGPP